MTATPELDRADRPCGQHAAPAKKSRLSSTSLRAITVSPRVLAVLVLQYFAIEFLVAGSWHGNYSYSRNFISDLGLPYCGTRGTESCTATHTWINASFALIGLTMWLAAATWRSRDRSKWVWQLMYAVAGAGMITSSFTHTNTHTGWQVHALATGLFFVFANLGTLGFAATSDGINRAARYVVIALSVLGVSAHFANTYTWYCDLGRGGIERVSAYCAIIGFAVLQLAIAWGRRSDERAV